MVVDIHAHFFPPSVIDLYRDRGGTALGVIDTDGSIGITLGGRTLHASVPAEMLDVGAHLEGMDRLGVATRMLSVPPPMMYWADPQTGLAICRAANEAFADMAVRHPGRFIASATLPLQDPPTAARELRSLKRTTGVEVVAIGSNVAGMELDDPRLEPFFESVAEADAAVFIHPMPAPGGSERLREYRLDLGLGMVLETTIAAARLICSGRLDRFPDLRLCWPHFGGLLPSVADRIELYIEHVPGLESHAARPFTDYLRTFWYDLTVYSERMVAAGLAVADPSRLLFGTDAPFLGDSTAHILEVIRASPSLDEQQREGILGGNVDRFLGRETDHAG